MNNKELQLCSYEQSKRLKNLGFDWIVFHTFDENDNPVFTGSQENYNSYGFCGRVSCPTVALALKWIRNVKGIHDVHIKYNSAGLCIFFIGVQIYAHFSTFEIAESALLDELLTLLEKEK